MIKAKHCCHFLSCATLSIGSLLLTGCSSPAADNTPTVLPTQMAEYTSASTPDASQTEAPAPTVTSKPELPTAAVTPTETPQPTTSPTIAPTAAPVEPEQTFAFSELTQTLSWGAQTEALENGSTLFTFPDQYSQLSLLIPDEVDKARLVKIVVNTTGDTSLLSVKIYGDEGMQAENAVSYCTNELSVDTLTADQFVCVGIMGLEAGYQISLDSITFIMDTDRVADAPAQETSIERVYYKPENENNPLVTQRYSADPGVMVYDGTVYIYSTNDIYEYSNGKVIENTYGKIKTLNCFSSTDLVNWTDHGTIAVAGSSGAAKWASNSWAPCAAHKTIDGQEKFFLYFANSAGGIGVLTANSPTGPWTDPLGKPLISKSTPTCDTVEWLFDPAVLVDDDGTGYLYFGGGIPAGKDAAPQTARVVKLGDDMISLASDPVLIDAPYLFEDSGINKIGDTYYYSYCSNWSTADSGYEAAAIEYMISDTPMGPFVYAGEIFKNPGVFFGVWGNNHHSIFELNGTFYLAYHARAVETGRLGKNLGYRSTQIDRLTLTDGAFESMTPSMTGVAQLAAVNPFSTVQAETIGRECGIEITGSGNTCVQATDGDWTCVKGVDFAEGASSLTLSVKAESEVVIEIRIGSFDGTLVGSASLSPTGNDFAEITVPTEQLSGVVDLYFVYQGEISFDYWRAEK